MNASLSCRVSGEPMYTAYSATSRYIVFRGQYTVSRYRKGRQQQVSIMHERYAGLRAQIDAAIAQFLEQQK